MREKKRKFFRRDDVARAVADAFGAAEFPGERACVKEASDASFAVLGDLGTDWRLCDPGRYLLHDALAVESLSEDGFRYFLPAFLTAVFDQGKEINEDAFFSSLLDRLEGGRFRLGLLGPRPPGGGGHGFGSRGSGH